MASQWKRCKGSCCGINPRRRVGQPRYVANTVLFLAFEAASGSPAKPSMSMGGGTPERRRKICRDMATEAGSREKLIADERQCDRVRLR